MSQNASTLSSVNVTRRLEAAEEDATVADEKEQSIAYKRKPQLEQPRRSESGPEEEEKTDGGDQDMSDSFDRVAKELPSHTRANMTGDSFDEEAGMIDKAASRISSNQVARIAGGQPISTQAASAYLEKGSEYHASKSRSNTMSINWPTTLSETQRRLISFENEKIRKIRQEIGYAQAQGKKPVKRAQRVYALNPNENKWSGLFSARTNKLTYEGES